jgi:hypothetical protein
MGAPASGKMLGHIMHQNPHLVKRQYYRILDSLAIHLYNASIQNMTQRLENCPILRRGKPERVAISVTS